MSHIFWWLISSVSPSLWWVIVASLVLITCKYNPMTMLLMQNYHQRQTLYCRWMGISNYMGHNLSFGWPFDLCGRNNMTSLNPTCGMHKCSSNCQKQFFCWRWIPQSVPRTCIIFYIITTPGFYHRKRENSRSKLIAIPMSNPAKLKLLCRIKKICIGYLQNDFYC